MGGARQVPGAGRAVARGGEGRGRGDLGRAGPPAASLRTTPHAHTTCGPRTQSRGIGAGPELYTVGANRQGLEQLPPWALGWQAAQPGPPPISHPPAF